MDSNDVAGPGYKSCRRDHQILVRETLEFATRNSCLHIWVQPEAKEAHSPFHPKDTSTPMLASKPAAEEPSEIPEQHGFALRCNLVRTGSLSIGALFMDVVLS